MKSVYIETTIPSLATSRPSRDTIIAGRQAAKRLAFLSGILVIPKSERIHVLADTYQRLLEIPDRAKIDCFHLAAAVAAGMDYLLSWNCAHLGIHTFIKIREHNEKHALSTPLLLTPEALMAADEKGGAL